MQDAIKKAEIEAKAKQDKVGPQGPLPSAFHYIMALPQTCCQGSLCMRLCSSTGQLPEACAHVWSWAYCFWILVRTALAPSMYLSCNGLDWDLHLAAADDQVPETRVGGPAQ